MILEKLNSQVADDVESTMSRRTLCILGGLVTLALGTFGLAGETGHLTPIQMPAGARQLPWLRSDVKAFLIDNKAISEANCGRRVTFLKSFYDDQASQQMDIGTVSDYERTMNSTVPGKLTASLRTEIEATAHTKSVVDCLASPTISYVQGASHTTLQAAIR